MRLLLIDFETTGLDPKQDRVIEIGFILKQVGLKKPLLEFATMLWSSDSPELLPVITKLTGISKEMLIEFGKDRKQIFEYLEHICNFHKIDYFVAHNGRAFDKKFLENELKLANMNESLLLAIPWLDTRNDLPLDEEPSSMRLMHLAGEYGFLNPFPHSALSDVQTMDKLLMNFSIEEVIASSKSPDIVIKALVTKEKKDLAKFNGFRWDSAIMSWTRTIKAYKFEDEKKRCIGLGFAITKM